MEENTLADSIAVGVPRNADKALMAIRESNGLVVNVSDEEIMERMSGRRVCEHCGASYHIVAVPPKAEGICDKCGGKLIQRHDDEPETVKARLEVYHKETEPLKEFYAKRGVLKTVENQPTVAATSEVILHALER